MEHFPASFGSFKVLITVSPMQWGDVGNKALALGLSGAGKLLGPVSQVNSFFSPLSCTLRIASNLSPKSFKLGNVRKCYRSEEDGMMGKT